MTLITQQPTSLLRCFYIIKQYHHNILILFIAILPFLISARPQPQTGFVMEMVAFILVLLFCLLVNMSTKNYPTPNKLFFYLLLVAGYLGVDSLINPAIYPQISLMYIGCLIVAGIFSLSVNEIIKQQGLNTVVATLFFGLMIGALLQNGIVIMQLLDISLPSLSLSYAESNGYAGNVGHRNLFAHYQFWGIIATCYLGYRQKIPKPATWVFIILQATLLGLGNSRVLLLFCLLSLSLVAISWVWQKHIDKQLLKYTLTSTLLVLVAQALVLPIVGWLNSTNTNDATSSLERVIHSSDITVRLSDWEKAWRIFMDSPLVGHGWASYGYQNFMTPVNDYFSYYAFDTRLSTHSHNLIFNLLAETGIIGTLVIVLGFLGLIQPIIRKRWSNTTFVLAVMLTATLCHSLVEFPLWYFHYFIIFVLLMTLILKSQKLSIHTSQIAPSALPTPQKPLTTPIYNTLYLLPYRLSLATALILAVVLLMGYYKVASYRYLFSENSPQDRIQTALAITQTKTLYPLLTPYIDWHAIDHILGIAPNALPTAFEQPLNDYAHFIPLKTIGIYYLAKQCTPQGDWTVDAWGYFERLNSHYGDIGLYSRVLSMDNHCAVVYQQIHQRCQALPNTVCSITH